MLRGTGTNVIIFNYSTKVLLHNKKSNNAFWSEDGILVVGCNSIQFDKNRN